MFLEVRIIDLSKNLNLNESTGWNNYLSVLVKFILRVSVDTGTTKVQRQLIKDEVSVSLKRDYQLMKSADSAFIIQKKYTPYKQSEKLVLEHENIREQDFPRPQLTKNGYQILPIFTFEKKVGVT